MIKKFVVAVLGLVVVVGLLGGIKALQIVQLIQAAENAILPPSSVTTATAETQSWRSTLKAVGTTVPVQGVTLMAEVPGTLKVLGFESGKEVKKGEVLVRLDISVEQAQLASAEAELKLAKLELDRAAGLRAQKVNSAAELDAAEARYAQAEAAKANIMAVINKKTIRAPFAGRLGTRQVNLGQFLNAGTPIVVLQSLDPLYVDFSLPQRQLARIGEGQDVAIRTDAFPEASWTGVLDSIDPEVDPSTRNVRLRALVDNEDKQLRPGMFVDVDLLLSESLKVVTIPATSVMYAPYGNSVYVVEKEEGEVNQGQLVAKQIFVRLGQRRGDLIAVDSGLEAGQTIVTTGAFKLRNGAPVVVNNELAPDARTDPKPEDT
ncbi:MAG: efflux RND transporter periplasmic adaptor subunit [Myxococcota bacterium]